MFAASDKVGERIYLVHHAARFAPRLAQFAAAANVRNYINHSPIQQRQPTCGKRWRNRNAVRSVSVKQQRRGTIQLHVSSINHGHWNLCSVRGGRENSLAFVIRLIESAGYFLLLQQRCLAGVHVVVKD